MKLRGNINNVTGIFQYCTKQLPFIFITDTIITHSIGCLKCILLSGIINLKHQFSTLMEISNNREIAVTIIYTWEVTCLAKLCIFVEGFSAIFDSAKKKMRMGQTVVYMYAHSTPITNQSTFSC